VKKQKTNDIRQGHVLKYILACIIDKMNFASENFSKKSYNMIVKILTWMNNTCFSKKNCFSSRQTK
jgi:hypothetical protein